LNLLEVSEAEAAALKTQSALATTDALTRILEVLADAEMRLRDAASKKILLEVSLLKAIEARHAVSLDAVLKQLQSLRGQGGASNAPPPAAANVPHYSAPPVAPRPKLALAETPPSLSSSSAATPPVPAAVAPHDSAGLAELWSRLVEAVTRASRFTGGYLLNAHPVSFAKNTFTIGYDPEFEDQIGLVDHARNHTLLQTKLAELGHPNALIKFIKAEAPVGRTAAAPTPPVATPPAPAAPTPATPKRSEGGSSAAKEKTASVPFNKDDFKNDPLIQKALEIFKGQIVEVRA
jgi:DNA polymerase-3 subunit gamma/tau